MFDTLKYLIGCAEHGWHRITEYSEKKVLKKFSVPIIQYLFPNFRLFTM